MKIIIKRILHWVPTLKNLSFLWGAASALLQIILATFKFQCIESHLSKFSLIFLHHSTLTYGSHIPWLHAPFEPEFKLLYCRDSTDGGLCLYTTTFVNSYYRLFSPMNQAKQLPNTTVILTHKYLERYFPLFYYLFKFVFFLKSRSNLLHLCVCQHQKHIK